MTAIPFRQGVRLCSIDGCDKAGEVRGWCRMHAQRWYRHGTTDLLEPDQLLPNPWVNVAPPCPRGHPPADVYLWHPSPEDGGRWICSPCGRRFDP